MEMKKVFKKLDKQLAKISKKSGAGNVSMMVVQMRKNKDAVMVYSNTPESSEMVMKAIREVAGHDPSGDDVEQFLKDACINEAMENIAGTINESNVPDSYKKKMHKMVKELLADL